MQLTGSMAICVLGMGLCPRIYLQQLESDKSQWSCIPHHSGVFLSSNSGLYSFVCLNQCFFTFESCLLVLCHLLILSHLEWVKFVLGIWIIEIVIVMQRWRMLYLIQHTFYVDLSQPLGQLRQMPTWWQIMNIVGDMALYSVTLGTVYSLSFLCL